MRTRRSSPSPYLLALPTLPRPGRPRQAPYPTREAWLGAAIDLVAPAYVQLGVPLPDRRRVSCSWPSHAAVGSVDRSIGQCWSPSNSADGTTELFISPTLDDPCAIGAVMIHELTHAAVGTDAGHGPAFRSVAIAMGLQPPMRATTASPELLRVLGWIGERLGAYPHARLLPSDRKRQTTRMLKLADLECELIVRAAMATIQQLEDGGGLFCGLGHRFVAQIGGTVREATDTLAAA